MYIPASHFKYLARDSRCKRGFVFWKVLLPILIAVPDALLNLKARARSLIILLFKRQHVLRLASSTFFVF